MPELWMPPNIVQIKITEKEIYLAYIKKSLSKKEKKDSLRKYMGATNLWAPEKRPKWCRAGICRAVPRG